MAFLKQGDSGPKVLELQQRLKQLGFNPGKLDGDFGPGTEAAVMAFQKSEGLLVDGAVGPRTLKQLGLAGGTQMPSIVAGVTVAAVSRMFPFAPLDRSGWLVTGVVMSNPFQPVMNMFQPPFSGGSLLARRCTSVPQSIIVMSVIEDMRVAVLAAQEGIDGYLTKPIDFDKLDELLNGIKS